jgi:50S ribosomal protein L16 3-hydroxylase
VSHDTPKTSAPFRLATHFSPTEFLTDIWQKKPKVIRGLFSQFCDPVSGEELAGLACEAELESRLVQGIWPGKLQLRQGPFQEADFTSLPATDWTLLVQAVDQWLPDIAALRRCFAFLPNWRLDDVMVSYAATGGTVGPHWDHYDVFLVQGSGRRRWRVGPRCTSTTALDTSTGLSLLSEFATELDVELQPGDALYLPPRFSHWGTATDAGLCYSIGFRAPSLADMIEGFSDALITRSNPDQRYEDPAPALPEHPAVLRPEQLDTAFAELTAQLRQRSAFDRWFGCHATQPRYPEQILPPTAALDEPTLERALTGGQALWRHPGSRFAFMPVTHEGIGELLCFVDGGCAELPGEEIQAVSKLCDLTIENVAEIIEEFTTGAGRALVLHLVNQGSLVLD